MPESAQKFRTPKERFLAEAHEALRRHEDEATRLREVIQKVENPPDGVAVEFSVFGVRFIGP